jgi:signal transduction histidine kinase
MNREACETNDLPVERNRRILIIDDNRAIHDDFRKILSADSSAVAALDKTGMVLLGKPANVVRQIRYEIDSAHQGHEGVMLVKQALEKRRPYAMAFVDVRMPPGWDGVETTQRILGIDPDIQIVICTAYADYSWEEMLEKLGGRDGLLILKKPFDVVEVLQLALALTEKWRLLQISRRKMEELESRVGERTRELQQTNHALQTEVTERKQIEARLFQSQKMETVGKLAGGIAHEFNSILTAIIGQSELMLNDLPPGSPLCKNATEISNAACRAATLTRQLLAYGRKQILQPEILDLNSILAGMEGTLRHLLGGGTDMHIAAFSGLKAVKVDAGQIEQVIMNVVINAHDAMPNGGQLTLETANVSFDQESVGGYPELKPGDYVMLAITDTGAGMSEEVKARVFEPFFTTKGVGQGTGLGLSTCYGIIKQSGGHISVYSEPGRGTTFKVYLPQVEPQAKIPGPRPATPELPRGTETILLVEDDPALREMAAMLLTRLGYTVWAAANGIEALSLKQRHDTGHIDLVFTDVVMPHMSGKELADRVQASSPYTRILFTSAYTENAIVHQGILTNGVALLQKPFTPSALAHKLREVLDQPISPEPDSAQTTFGFTKVPEAMNTSWRRPA